MKSNKPRRGAKLKLPQEPEQSIHPSLASGPSKLRGLAAAHGRQSLFLVLGAVVVPILFFLALETGLRVAGYGYPASFFVESDNPQRPDTVITNQDFGRRFFPAAVARTPEPCSFPRHKPDGTYRIFVLGGSAAMGVPEPAFSFARILEVMLRQQHPQTRFEVINAAMTAINSHVVLPIARDCAGHEADLFVIYMGNNEVVGPYGPATVFQRSLPSLAFIRAGVWLNTTRIGQLLSRSLLLNRISEPTEWKGMAMFLDRQVAADDRRMEQVYRNFRENLTGICRAGLRGGANVIVSTVATNLRDSAPFASLHREGMSAAETVEWEDHYKTGVESQARGDIAKALEEFMEAEKVDDRYAELHFRMARCHLALNDPPEARKRFALARDLDALRFRADTRINRLIREVARDLKSQGVELVDAERIFEQSDKTAHGILGDELFHEHVHLNFDGNYLLAKSVFDTVQGFVPVRAREGAADFVAAPTRDHVAGQMALTGWDRYKMSAEISAMMDQPPFTNQLDYELRKAIRTETVRTLKDLYGLPDALQEAEAAYRTALERSPGDLYLRRRLAELLAERGDLAGAAAEWRRLLEVLPRNKSWRTALASVLSDEGRSKEAIEQYRQVLEVDPEFAAAHFGIGAVLHKQGQLEEAAGSYREALRINPAYAEAENNLGLIFMARRQPVQAIDHYSAALRLKPDYAQAYNNRGLAWLSQGRDHQALDDFSVAVELDPNFGAAHSNLGGALARQGRLQEAVDHYAKTLDLRPKDALAHYGMGSALAGLGEVDQAIAHYIEAVRLKPDLAEAHYDLGVLLSRQGKLEEAQSRYSEALRLRPDYAEALNNMGTALARQGKFDQAIDYFSKALRVRPDFADARQNLQRAQGKERGTGRSFLP